MKNAGLPRRAHVPLALPAPVSSITSRTDRTNVRLALTGFVRPAYSRVMSQLLLIRHGQASFGTDNYDRLSPIGQRQARLVGRQLAAVAPSFDAWIAGGLQRQQHTARLPGDAFQEPPSLVVDTAFDEYDADALFRAYLPRVMADNAEIAAGSDSIHADRRLFQRAFEQVMRLWLAGSDDATGNFEAWADFKARVRAGLARLRDEHPRDAKLALFSSGGPIAVALGAALGASDATTIELNWSVYNASIAELRSTRTGWRMLGFNDISAQREAGDPALVTFR